MKYQKGLAPLLIVIIIALVIGGYFVYNNIAKNIKTQKEIESSQTPSRDPYTSDLPNKQVISSPDGLYIVTEEKMGDYNTISIQDKQGNIIVKDLVASNEKEMGLGTKIPGQYGVSFGGWSIGNNFTLLVKSANGKEYEFQVDAKTGKVDSSSFQEFKEQDR